MKAAVKVVGQVAGGREHVVAYAFTNDPVLLVPEPDNAYDPNAVAVYTAPRAHLQDPDLLVSCFTDPAGVGSVSKADRWLLMDRQAGYLPREFAARVQLPPEGIVGFISQLRYAPPEYVQTAAAYRQAEPRVAGFDVTADFPLREDR
jgi:hypothetical protein